MVAGAVGGMPRQGILSLAIKDKGALYNAYMPYVRGGGLFVPTTKRSALDGGTIEGHGAVADLKECRALIQRSDTNEEPLGAIYEHLRDIENSARTRAGNPDA